MRLEALAAALISMTLTSPVWAVAAVPEISSNGSLAALFTVAALVTILWERRRRA